MWFEELMDDFKNAMLLSDKYKGMYVPVLFKLAMGIILGVLFIGSFIGMLTGGILASEMVKEPFKFAVSMIGSMGVVFILMFIIYCILWSIIEIGTISLINAALIDEKPTKEHFLNGIKEFLGGTVITKVILDLVWFVTFPIWLTLFLIFMLTVGILTGGWGLILLGAAVSALFISWPIVIVNGNKRGLSAVKESIVFGRKNLKSMVVVIVFASLVSGYASSMFGPLVALIGAWLIGGAILIYSKIIIVMKYTRYKELDHFDR